MLTKRQQRTIGAIVKIPLGDGRHTYGQILPEADCAIFDARTSMELEIADIVRRPVLFRVAVYKHAFTRSGWPKVGTAPLREEFAQPVPKFMQDIIEPTSFSIYIGGQIRPASRAECVGLERSAVWEPEHVESRIRDHYNKVPNKWVESLKIR
jgi:hypothetical protein